MFGPLFGFEFVRLLRRRVFHMQRATYVLALFLAMFIIYARSFGFGVDAQERISPNQLALFGESFLIAFVVVQFIAILLLVPVYLGGAIVEERERKSWDFLLGSPLPTYQIVFGKLIARMIVVFMILAAGLPVLLIASFIGGIDPQRVLYAFALHAGLIFALGTFSFLLSLRAKSLLEVLLKTFGIMIAITVFGFCCSCMGGSGGTSTEVGTWFSPIAAQVMLLGDPKNFVQSTIWMHLIVCSTLGTVMLIIILQGVRQDVVRYPAPKEIGFQLVEVEMRSITESRTHREFFVPMLMESEDPLLWKERHFYPRSSGNQAGCIFAMWIFALVAVSGIVGVGIFVSVIVVEQTGILSTLHFYMLAALTLFSLRLGMRTASSFGIERQRGTLESLFMLPGDRVEILTAKWRGAIASIEIWLIIFFFSAFLLCWLCSPVNAIFSLISLLFTAAFLWFAVNLGLWLAVRTRSTTQASVIYIVVLLFCWVMPLISPQVLIYDIMEFCLNVERGRKDTEGQIVLLLRLVLIGAMYLGLGTACWRNAVSRLYRE